MKQSKKCLTLHLYRKDEVLAAMRWSIVNNALTETIFWGIELFDSDMEQDALKILEFTWITQIGFGSFSFLRRILDIYRTGELDRDSWISLLSILARVQVHDSTAFYLLIRGASMPDWVPRFSHSSTYTTLRDAVHDTLLRGKLLEAWLIARAMTPVEQWSILETLAIQRGRHSSLMELKETSLSDYEQRAAAFVLVSLDDIRWAKANEPFTKRELPSEVTQSILEWDAEESMRNRRIYAIKPEAILYLSERSEQSQLVSSEIDIQSNLFNTLLESSYWNTILADYMINGKWKSDLYKEMFYDTYFPCDIPDEWSAADREKSHGRGLGRSKDAGLKRFLDTILQRSISLGVWKYVKPDVYMSTMNWDIVYDEIYISYSPVLQSQLPLMAIRKIFEIT